MIPKLSFIIPTEGKRPAGLSRMLRSILNQGLAPYDEILVVGDPSYDIGPVGPLVRNIRVPAGHDWGGVERNIGIGCAGGTHLVFGDDDDAFLPGAVNAIREALSIRPNRPHMFRMIDRNGALLWWKPEVCMGNHGTPQFVVPNLLGMVGQFGSRYEGDFDFVTSTLALYQPNSLIWDSSIIYGCRAFGG